MSDNQCDIDCLSMGMSGDFEDAIAEGATLVRVGTALFGPRPPHAHRPLNRRQSLHQGKERIPLWDLWMNSSAWPTPTRMRTRTISRSLSRRLVLPSLSAGTAPSGWTARALWYSAPVEPERRSNKVVNIHTTTQLQVVLVKPERFENASEIADHLREKRTVVLNLESTNKEIARRLLDFLSGVAYANEGKIKKVAISTYIITPYNVDILGDLIDELENNGLYF